MAGQSTSTLSALLRPNVQSEVLDLQFRKTDFFDLLRANGRVNDNVGASPHQWNVITAVNAQVEVFTEGEAPPAPGKQTYAQASLGAFYVRGVAGETGHVRDNRAKGGYYADPFDTERLLVQADVFYKVEGELMGSTADRGIAAIIDSTGTYAGLAQGTYASWASEENGSVGVLSIDAMNTLFEELTSGSVSSVPRGAMPTHCLMPMNQVTNYLNTVGPGASSGALWRTQSGQTFDVGLHRSGPQFNFMPIVPCRLMTTTEVYMVDLTDIELLIHRDLQVDPIVGNPEMQSFQVSAAFLMKVGHRNHHGKMTGVTA